MQQLGIRSTASYELQGLTDHHGQARLWISAIGPWVRYTQTPCDLLEDV